MSKHTIHVLILFIIITIANGCSSKCISFDDEYIKMYMLEHYDKDGDKCISNEEALMVTEIKEEAFCLFDKLEILMNNNQKELANILSAAKEEKDPYYAYKEIQKRFKDEIDTFPCPYSLNDLNKFPNLQTIRARAFGGCPKIKNIKLKYVSKLENEAFEQCFSVDEVDMPNLTDIGDECFGGLPLNTIKLTTHKDITIGHRVLDGSNATLILHSNKRYGSSGSPSVDSSGKNWGGISWAHIDFVD